jgi:hypothetical protein
MPTHCGATTIAARVLEVLAVASVQTGAPSTLGVHNKAKPLYAMFCSSPATAEGVMSMELLGLGIVLGVIAGLKSWWTA